MDCFLGGVSRLAAVHQTAMRVFRKQIDQHLLDGRLPLLRSRLATERRAKHEHLLAGADHLTGCAGWWIDSDLPTAIAKRVADDFERILGCIEEMNRIQFRSL